MKKLARVAILAGGKGTRLAGRSGDLPKPMIPLLGKPVLQHQVELCRKYGFCNIVLLVHHHHEKISDYFRDGINFGVSINYSIEKEPRGTAGALRDALHLLEDQFIVLYGDTFIDVNLSRLWKAHLSSECVGTLLLHPNDHPHDSDLVDIDLTGIVRAIYPYPHPPDLKVRNLVNAALYVLDRNGLEDVTPIDGKADIAKHMFKNMLQLGRRLHGYVTSEYIKDMGTPDRLDKVEHDIIIGLPEKLSFRNLRSAIFLDRDGTLIRECNHLSTIDQLELLPGVADAIRRINHHGTLSIVVTNQPVIARGELTLKGLDEIHGKMESLLGAEGAYIDGIYVCPHHPDKGFLGEIQELKHACLCRKPEPGLINKACIDFEVDRRKSWVIGDTTSDIEAGRRSGIRTILLRTGYAGGDGKYAVRPDYICPDLKNAVQWILKDHANLTLRMTQIAIAATNNKRIVLIGGLARAGKSFAAQVLKEVLDFFGYKAHVVSLDGWLKPNDRRSEGAGVCDRFDLIKASKTISSVALSKNREIFREPLYDRIRRISGSLVIEHSVGPKDIIIVEGVPALLLDEINKLPNTLKVFLEVEPEIRLERLIIDYVWRGYNSEQIANLVDIRNIDEVPVVTQSRKIADFILANRINLEN